MPTPRLLRALDPTGQGPSDTALQRDATFAELLARSYFAHSGQHLFPPEMDANTAAVWLYERAPFCLLAHNTAADPRFIYVNRVAQACFEYTWEELTQLPSRLSAGPDDWAERQAFIDRVKRDGWASGYRGLRVAKSGRVFWIEDVILWQVANAAGTLLAQAAVYHHWQNA